MAALARIRNGSRGIGLTVDDASTKDPRTPQGRSDGPVREASDGELIDLARIDEEAGAKPQEALGVEAPSRRGHRTRERRRRPTGTAPPLPHDLGATGKLFIALAILLVGLVIIIASASGVGAPLERADDAVVRWFASLRTGALTDVVELVNGLGSRLTIRIARWAIVIALIVFQRWRHLLVLVGVVFVAEATASLLQSTLQRPRPLGVEIIAGWSGGSMPSRPMVSLGVTALGACYALVPHGRLREISKLVTAGLLVALGLAELYLGTFRPSDVLVGGVLGVALGLAAFRWFAPGSMFPVTYGRGGRASHLDVGGMRGQAIRTALRDQLGFDVMEIKPVGLAASGGSTPMMIKVRGLDGRPRTVFAKLLAKTHVRSDRWYKLGRSMLYGRLEDELSFKTVRRLAEGEDYRERLVRDAGIRTALPNGIVEITPEREYLIVTEFFEGAVELSEAEVDDAVIDEGLLLVLKLWDAGIAHRDLKPANLMVRDGELLLIDVGFAAVRPTPWRQAVDLGNMMLCLALRSDAERVYERAIRYFSADEIAEAFAATRSIAIPTELRTRLKEDGRDLIGEFRALAPERRRIPIQSWSIRRVMTTLFVAALAAIAVAVAISAQGVL